MKRYKWKNESSYIMEFLTNVFYKMGRYASYILFYFIFWTFFIERGDNILNSHTLHG